MVTCAFHTSAAREPIFAIILFLNVNCYFEESLWSTQLQRDPLKYQLPVNYNLLQAQLETKFELPHAPLHEA